MFYVKQSFGYADAVTEIKQDNVFTKCHECNAETQVDLAKLAKHRADDLLDVHMLCEKCSEKYAHRYPEDTPPTIDAITFLVSALKKRGYDDDVAFMYNNFCITSVNQLEEDVYGEFVEDLLLISEGKLDEKYSSKPKEESK